MAAFMLPVSHCSCGGIQDHREALAGHYGYPPTWAAASRSWRLRLASAGRQDPVSLGASPGAVQAADEERDTFAQHSAECRAPGRSAPAVGKIRVDGLGNLGRGSRPSTGPFLAGRSRERRWARRGRSRSRRHTRSGSGLGGAPARDPCRRAHPKRRSRGALGTAAVGQGLDATRNSSSASRR
jgi:hypothetical protein